MSRATHVLAVTSRVNSTWIVTPVGPDTAPPLLLGDGGVHALPPLSLTLTVMRSASELPGVISGDRSIANMRSAPSATAIEDGFAEILGSHGALQSVGKNGLTSLESKCSLMMTQI